MTLSTIRRSLDSLGARLFQRDHPARLWRASGEDGASPEERTLYRSFAAAQLREWAARETATP